MKKQFVIGILALVAATAACAQAVPQAAPDKTPVLRSVSGVVHDSNSAPIQDAIVYLKNVKSLAVKSFIVSQEGKYDFHGLLPNVDYELWAEAKGRKSEVKTVSQFDSRKELVMNLKID